MGHGNDGGHANAPGNEHRVFKVFVQMKIVARRRDLEVHAHSQLFVQPF